ncbi:MAG: hypothetical protein B6D41_01715 [Chloroflexi bacterium UTCFX4]|jgi:hypothetical protein|nr:MAG: hypothetical protein B6D41_01715 [Chloroflexi bacterium UTCFX4]
MGEAFANANAKSKQLLMQMLRPYFLFMAKRISLGEYANNGERAAPQDELDAWCANCFNPNRVGAKFCRGCGKTLAAD